MMTLAQASAAYPVGAILRYGVSHWARVLSHEVGGDGMVDVIVEDEYGARRKWWVDQLAASGVTVGNVQR